MERAFDADFTQGSRPLPRARRHRRAAQAVVRGPHARRGAQGARRARRVLGSLPDVHAAARRRLARVAPTSPVFGDVDHPGIGTLRTPASPLQFPDRTADRTRAGAAARHAHRRGARRRARPLRPPRSGSCTTTASSPARSSSDDRGRRTHPRRRRVRRARPRPGAARSRRRGSRRASTSIPSVLDHGLLPALWHWALFHPEVPTAALGVDGHPRRRRRDGRVPAAHVGGRAVHVTRPLRIGVDAERVSRIVKADVKEGGAGRFWLVTVGHTIEQEGAPHIEEEQDLVFRTAGRARAHRPRRRRRTRRRVGRGTRRRPEAAVPLLRGHRERAPHPLRPPVRDRRRGLPRPRRARTAHRDPARRAPHAPVEAATRARGLVPRPRPALRQPPLLARGITDRRRRSAPCGARRRRDRDDPRGELIPRPRPLTSSGRRVPG